MRRRQYGGRPVARRRQATQNDPPGRNGAPRRECCVIHNWDGMFNQMKEIELRLDKSMAPEERAKFFDDDDNVATWLKTSEAWCKSANLARDDLGDHHEMYMIWFDGQYLW
jgi:hypothetical protein